MNLKPLLISLLVASVALAGCADKEPDDGDDPAQDPTKGAISGLLVDHNFRPIELKEDWNGALGEYQDRGFILVEETAERVHTNENGEFDVTGLDPGRYTLRVAADNHEAITQTVDVEASEAASVTLEARGKTSASNPILTIEYSGFIPCATGGVLAVTADCTTDFGGETYRPGPIEDYRALYGTDLHYLVIEAAASQPGDYSLVFREDDVTGSGGAEYGRTDMDDFNDPYFKIIFENSAVYGTKAEPPTGATHENYYTPEHNPRFKGQNDGSMRCGPDGQEPDGHDPSDYCSWPNSDPNEDETYNPMEALIFYWGEGDVATAPGTPATNEFGVGYGAKVAVKVNYVLSVFIGEPTPSDSNPADDLNQYCVLCDGYLDDQ